MPTDERRSKTTQVIQRELQELFAKVNWPQSANETAISSNYYSSSSSSGNISSSSSTQMDPNRHVFAKVSHSKSLERLKHNSKSNNYLSSKKLTSIHNNVPQTSAEASQVEDEAVMTPVVAASTSSNSNSSAKRTALYLKRTQYRQFNLKQAAYEQPRSRSEADIISILPGDMQSSRVLDASSSRSESLRALKLKIKSCDKLQIELSEQAFLNSIKIGQFFCSLF